MPAPPEILVAAAASLTESFAAIGKAFETQEKKPVRVRFTFAASGAIVQQVRAGAPIDVAAFAGSKEMDTLAAAHRIESATRRNFASNRLVLIASASAKSLRNWEGLRDATIHHLAISNPLSVPSGRYAQESLEKRGLWAAVLPRIVQGQNVRQTLTYVANGDAEAGIVFATDARTEKRVRVVAVAVPGRDHDPIVYPAAVVAGGDTMRDEAARRFVAFLGGETARKILRAQGFSELPSALGAK